MLEKCKTCTACETHNACNEFICIHKCHDKEGLTNNAR